MTTKVRRHPILGFFAGLFFGILPVTVMWLGISTLGFAVLGVVLAYVAPSRGSS
jgi:uncharacterized membrane protein